MNDPASIRAVYLASSSDSPLHTFKHDGRTRVWLATTPTGDIVIKRFERMVLRQWAARLLGIHPGQIESRRTDQLRAAGLPVPPILAMGYDHGKRWHAYPFAGRSLLWRLRDGDLAKRQVRVVAIHSLAKLVADLLAAGWIHSDFKTSNILVDDSGKLWMIDVGAVERPAPAAEKLQVAAMLATLDLGARLDKASRADRLRFLRLLVELRPALGDAKTLAREVGRIVLK